MVRKILLAIGILVVVTSCSKDLPRQSERQGVTRSATEEDVRRAVLFLGTSLTAGMGVGAERAYPALIQEKIDSLGWPFRTVNAGESGGTSAGGVRRIGWLLRQPVAVLILELGANDGLRGQDIPTLRANLQAIIDLTLEAYPDAQIVIAGMEAPPNLGPDYTSDFRSVFGAVARDNGVHLIPFILDGVAGVPELNQADGIHPTAEGQRVMADVVWKVLEPVLRSIDSLEGF
ncbi:MAG: arylesterase [Gemmatimonadota bacterium]|nr:MAG: arylesterase [Gemmatimonadota bacterium]